MRYEGGGGPLPSDLPTRSVIAPLRAAHPYTGLMIVAGVDISLGRGQTVALLDTESMQMRVERVRGAIAAVYMRARAPRGEPPTELYDGEAAAVASVLQREGVAVVAVDSPLQPSRLLLRDPRQRQQYGVPP